MADTPTPPKRSRRWFLRSLVGIGAIAAAGKGVDWLLPRTLCRAGEWHGPVTDHFDGTYFHNLPEDRPETSYGTSSLFRWLRERHLRQPYPRVEKNAHRPRLAPRVDGRHWEVTMVNHSTMLLRLAGVCVLTDPVWSDYTSPIQGFGPRRTRPVGIPWEELPPSTSALSPTTITTILTRIPCAAWSRGTTRFSLCRWGLKACWSTT